MGILLLLISLLVLAGLVAGIVFGIRALTQGRDQFEEADPGIGTVRRLYFYLVSFVALMMTINGLVLLVAGVLEALFGATVISSSNDSMLAWGIALILVGTPLWAFHWRLVIRQAREFPIESRSIIRKVYLYGVMVIGASFVIGLGIQSLRVVFGDEGFRGYPWAAVLVWAIVWTYHLRVETQEGQPTPETRAVRRLYLYSLSAVTLAIFAVGLGQVLHAVLREAYENLVSANTLSRPGIRLSDGSISALLVGGGVWTGHWLYMAREDYDSTLRQIYIFGYTILGGVVTGLIAMGIVIYGILEWNIGMPSARNASSHFDFFPAAVASLLVAATILVYHWIVSNRELQASERTPLGGRRSVPYALTAIGLVTTASAMIAVTTAIIDVVSHSGQAMIAGADLWRNQMALALTATLFGIPMWAYYWTSVQRRVSREDGVARTHLARRAFIFAVLAAGMLAFLASISEVLFVVINGILEGDLSDVLEDARLSLSVIVPVAIFVPYHWMVYRADREAASTLEEKDHASRKAVTVLVEPGANVQGNLEAVLHYDVKGLRWADEDAEMPELSDSDYRELAALIGGARGPSVLLVPDKGGYLVLSYE